MAAENAKLGKKVNCYETNLCDQLKVINLKKWENNSLCILWYSTVFNFTIDNHQMNKERFRLTPKAARFQTSKPSCSSDRPSRDHWSDAFLCKHDLVLFFLAQIVSYNNCQLMFILCFVLFFFNIYLAAWIMMSIRRRKQQWERERMRGNWLYFVFSSPKF